MSENMDKLTELGAVIGRKMAERGSSIDCARALIERLAQDAEAEAGDVDPDDPDFAGLREELAWHTARYLREYVLPPPPNQGSEST